MTGFVYLIESSSGLFKVGYSADPATRLAQLRTSTADDLTIRAVIPGTLRDEADLHDALAPWRTAREWFTDCIPIRALIVSGDQIEQTPAVPFEHAAPLRAWREANKLRGEDAASSAGVTFPMWSRWETGARRIPAERVPAMSALTGIPASELRPDVFAASLTTPMEEVE